MGRHRRIRSRALGYNLVAVVMLIAVLNVLVAAALPLWSTAIRRDKEEELISRGLQYAEAIRVFQRRFGRLPNRLQELLEVEPRCIRQLWEDPITGSKKWRLIVDGMGAPVPGQQPIPGQPPSGLGGDAGDPPQSPPEPIGGGEDEEEEGLGAPGTPVLVTGPIRGVKSRSDEEAIKLFFGKSRYGEWEFKVDLLLAPPVGAPGMPSPRLNATVLGRPFRYPPPGGIPGTQLVPGGKPSENAPPLATPPPVPGVGIRSAPADPRPQGDGG